MENLKLKFQIQELEKQLADATEIPSWRRRRVDTTMAPVQPEASLAEYDMGGEPAWNDDQSVKSTKNGASGLIRPDCNPKPQL